MTDSLSLSYRQKIAMDSIVQAPNIVAQHKAEGASLESSFVSSQLPPLDQSRCPSHPPSRVEVFNYDAFTVARRVLADVPSAHSKIAVLNLASDEVRAGGWEQTLSRTQEEALCYSSTLYATLKEEYYPWPNTGPGSTAGVFSPGVVIHREDLDHNLVALPAEKRAVVSVLTVAAPRDCRLDARGETFRDPSVLEDLREKIRLVCRMAAHNGKDVLILGAMGCGVYGCPPPLVAQEMKSSLLSDEFRGWFRKIVFAVFSKHEETGNHKIFLDAFRGVEV